MATTMKGKGSAATGPGRTPPGVFSPAVGSGIRRLHPVDGLFLRAEHLDQIQDHGAELARLASAAGGSGVVYGFTLDLGGETLGSSAGLAIDPSGLALRSPHRLEVDLADLAHDGGRVWLVEVVAAQPVRSGNEPLYSAVCASPCGPESSVQPWSETAVRLQVRPEMLGVETGRAHLVSAVASAYFDRERRDADPWLTPTSSGAVIAPLVDRPWAAANPATPPGTAGVPLGLLIRVGDAWYLDAWSARRDRMVTPPAAAWQGRLGCRPEPVFTAQVLQFQDQLARGQVGPKDPLTDRFVELPPAGFLPLPAEAPGQERGKRPIEEWIEEWLDAVFGGSVSLQVNRCSADVALSAVQLAQNLDRTPLNPYVSDERDGRPKLEVLLPRIPAHLPAVRTQPYPWLAFLRMPRLEPLRDGYEPQTPTLSHDGLDDTSSDPPDEIDRPVTVFVADAPRVRADYSRAARKVAAGKSLAEVRFAGSGWQTEVEPDTARSIRAAVAKGGDYTDIDLVVTAADADREPLLVARARWLAGELGLGAGESDRSVGIYSARLEGPDTVMFMVRRKR